MQQLGQVAAQHAIGRGLQLVVQGQAIGAHPLEGLRAEAGLGHIGGQQLQLGVQVAGLGAAAQAEGVIIRAEAGADDLGGHGLVDVLGGHLLQSALDEGAGRPQGRRRALGQIQTAIAETHLHRHLVLAEGGRLDR